MIFKIRKEYNNYTIEEYLSSFYLGRSYRYKLEVSKSLFVNGLLANLKTKLSTNDELLILFENIDKTSHETLYEKINILYEDEHFLLVQKEEKLLVHSDGTNKKNLSSMVEAYFQNKGIITRALHRLDYEATGFIIFSKHLLAHTAFDNMFRENQITREYTCLCEGRFDISKGVIETSISSSRHDKKQIINPKGKYAKTLYEVISYKNNITKLKVQIETGRPHQIRVHLASIGHPIVGDVLYGSKFKNSLKLHFTEISFIHPFTKLKFSYTNKPTW